MKKITLHVNSRYVESDTPDLDVYDRPTLERAVQSLAENVNFWLKRDDPEKAEPHVKFKNRIKLHLSTN
jgi:hypothetical protein